MGMDIGRDEWSVGERICYMAYDISQLRVEGRVWSGIAPWSYVEKAEDLEKRKKYVSVLLWNGGFEQTVLCRIINLHLQV